MGRDSQRRKGSSHSAFARGRGPRPVARPWTGAAVNKLLRGGARA